jgi:hypothetical protein
MKSSRLLKVTAVVGASALILGAFAAGPAEAKKKKKKKPAVCATYVPYEPGAGAPIGVVTPAATTDAPLTATVSTEAGLGTSTNETEDSDTGALVSHAYYNVQVDSITPSAYLYVRLEFPGYNDYDLFLRNPDGTSDIYSAGGPPYQNFADGTGHGGHAEGGPTGASENIDGATATDCQGFTLDIVSATTQGGDVTVKAWLGEAPPAYRPQTTQSRDRASARSLRVRPALEERDRPGRIIPPINEQPSRRMS